LVRPHKLKLKILEHFDQRLLRYSTFYIWGHLRLKHRYSLVCYLNLSFKFWEDPTSGCWYILFLIFKVIFHCRLSSFYTHRLEFKVWIRPAVSEIFYFWYLRLSSIGGLFLFIVWFGHISLSLKLGEDPTGDCWDISFLIFEVIFNWGSPSFEYFFRLSSFYTHRLEFKNWIRPEVSEIFYF
jgi:hypothetical protein